MPAENEQRRAILLVGSIRGIKSTSFSIGSRLLKTLSSAGFQNEVFVNSALLNSADEMSKFFQKLETADVFIVAFPVYVDQLPAPLIKTLESIRELRRGLDYRRFDSRQGKTRLAAIINCAFPENVHLETSASIMERFAGMSGFSWAGALCLAQGEAIGGKPLERTGRLAKNVVKAVEAAGAELASGGLVPEEAKKLMSRPLLPGGAYSFIANLSFRLSARRNKALKRMRARPYSS